MIKRIPLLKVTKSYRTVATDSLHVLAGVRPLYLTCESLQKFNNLKRMKKKIHIKGEEIDHQRVEWQFPIHQAPWVQDKINWTDTDEVDHQNMLYTDGSKLLDRVGFAYLHVFNNEVVEEKTYRMSDYATVFNAELNAIMEAMKYIKQKKINKAVIRSDSKAALMAISSKKSYEEVKKIYELQDPDIQLQWVKAHNGEVLNERVDGLAKQATHKENIDIEVKYPEKLIKKKLNEEINEEWQLHWDQSEN